MQRRRGRGALARGRPRGAAPSSAPAFGGPSGAVAESSDSDTPSLDASAVNPASVIAAAAAATAKRAARRAEALGKDGDVAGDVGYGGESDGEAEGEAESGPAASGGRAAGGERKSRYIEKLVKQAAVRKDAADAAMERRLARERETEDAMYEGKEKFVTAAYRETLKRREAAEGEDEGHGGGGGEIAKGGGRARGVAASDDRGGNVGKALLDAQAADAGAAEDVAGRGDRKRRRWGAPVASVAGPSNEGKAPVEGREGKSEGKKIRGLRRNDEEMIEKYRQRYFLRREKGLAETARAGVLGAK